MQQSFYLFTPTEIALYFYLLESANLRKWPDTFTCINRKVENDLGVSYKTLAAAKNRLRQTGLIDFKSKNGSKVTTFSLTFGNITKVRDEVRDEVLGEVRDEVSSSNLSTFGNSTKVVETIGNSLKVGDEVSPSHNNEFDKENNIYNNINNNIYNIPPIPPQRGKRTGKIITRERKSLKGPRGRLEETGRGPSRKGSIS